MAMLCRPEKYKLLADKSMRAAQSLGENLPVQKVFFYSLCCHRVQAAHTGVANTPGYKNHDVPKVPDALTLKTKGNNMNRPILRDDDDFLIATVGTVGPRLTCYLPPS